MSSNNKANGLSVRTAQAWTSLVMLCANPDSKSRPEMLTLMEEIMDPQNEERTALSVDLMKAGEELDALRAHSDRLFGFLLTVLRTCKTRNFAAAKPHAESLREYAEAWDARERTTEAELRRRFEELARHCTEHSFR